MNKKIPFLISLIAILFLAGVVVLIISMQEIKEDSVLNGEELIEDKTISWETFKHPYYNFKIDFPSGWRGGVNNYVWAPGSIGLADEIFAFCPPDYDNETCTSPSAPGGPISIDGPILLFICVEGSWVVPGEKCKTEEEFSAHYHENIWRPKLEKAIKRVNLSYWKEKRTLRAELILFDSAYETIYDEMVSSFESIVIDEPEEKEQELEKTIEEDREEEKIGKEIKIERIFENSYINKKYNYKIEHPEDYRLAISITKGRFVESLNNNIEYKDYYSVEDFIVITNLSSEEEENYLDPCENYHGGCYVWINFPAGTITLTAVSGDNKDVEKEVKEYENWTEEEISDRGYHYSDFYKEETISGLEISRWKQNWTMMGRKYEVASIKLPEKFLYPPSEQGYLNEIRFYMRIGDNYEKDLIAFNKILSSFEFLD